MTQDEFDVAIWAALERHERGCSWLARWVPVPANEGYVAGFLTCEMCGWTTEVYEVITWAHDARGGGY